MCPGDVILKRCASCGVFYWFILYHVIYLWLKTKSKDEQTVKVWEPIHGILTPVKQTLWINSNAESLAIQNTYLFPRKKHIKASIMLKYFPKEMHLTDNLQSLCVKVWIWACMVVCLCMLALHRIGDLSRGYPDYRLMSAGRDSSTPHKP